MDSAQVNYRIIPNDSECAIINVPMDGPYTGIEHIYTELLWIIKLYIWHDSLNVNEFK